MIDDPFLALMLLIAGAMLIIVPAYDLGELHGFKECMKIKQNKRERKME